MKLLDFRRELKAEVGDKLDADEVDYILAYVLDESVTKLSLLDIIDEKACAQARRILKKRLTGMPLDKIIKEKYFYGRPFVINNNVLSPRPETELLVETAINYIKNERLSAVLDLCAGSGCIGITLNLETGIDTTCSDVSKAAVKVARINSKKFSADVRLIHSNMFKRVKGGFDLIVSNPPYISSKEISGLDVEVKNFDPMIALDGGADGLDYYREIASNARDYLNPSGLILLEIGENQKDDIVKIFSSYIFEKSIVDYNQIDRILVFRRNYDR